jgi:CheY-like chemotaxis protein
MALIAVLAVGVEPSILASQRPLWQLAGYHLTSAGSIREAIVQLRDGDFDLILLDHSIPKESRERLTFLIRTTGLQISVVSVTDSPCDDDRFADATLRNDRDDFLQVIGELLAKRVKDHAAAREDRPPLHLLTEVLTLQTLWSGNGSRSRKELR